MSILLREIKQQENSPQCTGISGRRRKRGNPGVWLSEGSLAKGAEEGETETGDAVPWVPPLPGRRRKHNMTANTMRGGGVAQKSGRTASSLTGERRNTSRTQQTSRQQDGS